MALSFSANPRRPASRYGMELVPPLHPGRAELHPVDTRILSPQIPCAAGEQRVYEFFALTLAGSFGNALVFQFHRVRHRLQHGIGDGFGTASSKVFKRTRFRR